ncbi:Gfo/Idh/MocA family protein [Haloprofundus halobius]|uniref:Gfo/Idh/MocA family protein n=1 Tax=Haloprofundus halobius TaxID=2876194 RepID=UPI001CCCDB6C|nr:Gfo/Idh/MocA family oxidoreductase [Haloprofundus halobius]
MQRIVAVGSETAVRKHVERYRRFDDATVCGVVDADREPCVDEGVGFDDIDVPRYHSLSEVLQTTDGDVDGVDICGPGAAFVDALETALAVSTPVRCDPPVAFDAETFDRLVTASTESEGWILSHSPHRFSRMYERLHSAVESGGIGPIGVARIERAAPFDGPGWNVSYDGVSVVEGPVRTLCAVLAHDVDVLEWTFGPVERVFVRARAGGRYDHAHAVFAFRDGGRATVGTRWHRAETPAPRIGVEYSGKHGRLDFSEDDASTALREGSTPLAVDPPEDDCRGRALRAFIDRLGGSERPPTDVAPVTSSRVVVAARRSADENRPVTLAEESP